MIIKTGVLGVSGYTGQELVRLLHHHPTFQITALFSTSLQGAYGRILPEFSQFDLPDVVAYDVEKCDSLDVLFLAVPHTKAMGLIPSLMERHQQLKIIDLSADFRLKNLSDYDAYYDISHSASDYLEHAVYGLPEKYHDEIAATRLCANPGCYATAMILGLLPLLPQLQPTTPITIDAKSGVSGAGKALKVSSLFCEIHNEFSAYATGEHRHMAELIQESGLSNVLFSPHLVPIERGIEAAIYIHLPDIDDDKLHELFSKYYLKHPFATVYPSSTRPSTRLVNHTNRCALIPKKRGEWVVVFSLLDNLQKGASGQAIQNANIMFGLDQATGLL